MSTNKKFFSGNSIEQAVLQAARHFEIDASEVAYRQVERRHGFLKTRRRAVIEVDVENHRRKAEVATISQPAAHQSIAATAPTEARGASPQRPAEEPPEAAADPIGAAEAGTAEAGDADTGAVEARSIEGGSPVASEANASEARANEVGTSEASAGDVGAGEVGAGEKGLTSLPVRLERELQRAQGEAAEAAQEAVRRLCALGRVDIEADIFEGEDGLEIEISGADEGVFLEDRGRLLLAMQHLLPRLVRGLTGESVSCRVDCDNFQEIRAEQLRVLAQKVAAEVRDRGRSRTLEPMSPDERRIVHMTLADDRAVETESQGSGLFKRVMVMPANRRSRSFGPYKR